MIVDIIQILITVLLFLVIWGALLSPFESLGRRAWWFGDNVIDTKWQWWKKKKKLSDKKHICIFLEWIDRIDHESIHSKQLFIDELQEELPDYLIIDHIFPYSPFDLSILWWRKMDRFWKRVVAMGEKKKRWWLPFIINIRNLNHVLVSADKRYGPLHNTGVAQTIYNSIVESWIDVTQPDSNLLIISTSGWSQIGLGATHYLSSSLSIPIDHITIWGVMSSDPWVQNTRILTNIVWTKDNIAKIGVAAFRWRRPILWQSHRNKHKKNIATISMNCTHNGKNGYFSDAHRAETLQHVLDTI